MKFTIGDAAFAFGVVSAGAAGMAGWPKMNPCGLVPATTVDAAIVIGAA